MTFGLSTQNAKYGRSASARHRFIMNGPSFHAGTLYHRKFKTGLKDRLRWHRHGTFRLSPQPSPAGRGSSPWNYYQPCFNKPKTVVLSGGLATTHKLLEQWRHRSARIGCGLLGTPISLAGPSVARLALAKRSSEPIRRLAFPGTAREALGDRSCAIVMGDRQPGGRAAAKG
jgi:hypothetical protein